MLNPNEVKIVLEAALLAAQEPIPVAELRKMFDEEIGADTIRRLLEELREAWKERGVELATTASGWRFQTRASYQKFLERIHPEKAPRYSRAVLETLAIVAYRQPVTRGDIEEVRGVTASAEVIGRLEERGWVEVIGHKEVPGRPALYATTKIFLDDLGLRSLPELPPLDDIANTLELTQTPPPASQPEPASQSDPASQPAPDEPATARAVSTRGACREASQGSCALGSRLAPRHGSGDRFRQARRQWHARRSRAARGAARSGRAGRAPGLVAVRGGRAAPADLPQAGRGARHRARPFRQADRVRPPAENAGQSLDRDRPAGLQFRRAPALHRLG